MDAAHLSRPRSRRLVATLTALALAVVAVTVFGTPQRATAIPHAAALTLTAGADGALAFAGSATTGASTTPEPMALDLTTDRAAEIEWDLTGLDRTRYRSDLVHMTLAGFEGPGRFTATTTSPFGATEMLLDSQAGLESQAGNRFVLQVGHQGTMQWSFDKPGTYEVSLTAAIPEVGGATATATTAYELSVTEGSTSDSIPPASPDVAEHRTPVPASPDRRGEIAAVARPSLGAPATPSGTQVVIDDGHVDMGPRFVDGSWRVQLRDDSTAPVTWRDLTDVVLHAREGSRIQVPPGDAYAFLGAPGSPVYVLPLVQQAGLVWPGWNTQDPSVLDAVPGSVTWRLRGVEGPGRFLLYLTGTFGQTDVLFDTAGALPQELEIGRNTHVHGNWAFTEGGIYRLSVEMSATTADGTPVSDTRILTIAVGDAVDPHTAFTPDPNPGPDPSGDPTPTPDPTGADVEISATLGNDPAGSGGGQGSTGKGGGSLVQTGIDGVGPKVALALVLIGTGAVLVAVRRKSRPTAEPI